MAGMGGVDALIVTGFAAYAIASGLRARAQASRGLEEYFLAGRSLPGWKAGISMAATQFAADTPLLVMGLIATAGVFSLWRLWIYALAFLLLGFVLAPAWRRAGVLTDAALAELRYGGRAAALLRIVKALYFGTVFNCTVLAMVLFAAAAVVEPFLLWDQWLPAAAFDPVVALVRFVGVPFVGGAADASTGDPQLWLRSARNLISLGLLLAVTLAYSTTGGLRSVVRTDLVQFGLMMAATAGYAIWLMDQGGGLDSILDELRRNFAAGGPGGISPDEIVAFTPSRAKDASFLVMSVLALQWLVQMNADGTGYLAQRSMACRSDADARQASVIFSFAQVLLRSLLWLPIGVALLVLFPPDLGQSLEVLRAEREASFVRGMQSLPPGLLGLMLAAMLAALASTIDSHLNWGASYWAHDLYGRGWCRGVRGRDPSEAALVRVARISNLLILAVALVIMTQLSSIQAAWQVSLLLGSGMGVMLVLRWLWWRITARGEITCIAVSSLLAPVLLATLPPEQEALRLLAVAFAATGAGIAVSYLGRAETDETLLTFYERVRPPGFWGPFAERLAEPPRAGVRRLTDGLVAAGWTAFSIFALLVSLGSWMLGSQPPLWFPWPVAWQLGLFAAGLAVVPLWWRRAFGSS